MHLSEITERVLLYLSPTFGVTFGAHNFDLINRRFHRKVHALVRFHFYIWFLKLHFWFYWIIFICVQHNDSTNHSYKNLQ